MTLRTVSRRRARLALALLATPFALLLAWPDAADAGRYVVAQCDPVNRAFADAEFERRNGGDYAFLHRCEEDEDASSLQIHTLTGAPQNHYGRIGWAAPGEARIVGVALEARLRSDSGHEARLSFTDPAGVEVARIATGKAEAGGFERYERQLTGAGRDRFAAGLVCTQRSGCPASEQARTWVRSIRLTIDDPRPPVVAAAGSLLAPGWHRGEGTLAVSARDGGSGVRRIETHVGLAEVAPTRTFPCAVVAGSALVTRTRPCAASQSGAATLDTAAAPFADGPNVVTTCAIDYGSGDERSCARRVVLVDNAPPSAAFAPIDRSDPELIRARVADSHSGMRGGSIALRPLGGGAWRELPTRLIGGELRARLHSRKEPPDSYLLRVAAADVAGNATTSTRRTDGKRMVVTLPLRERTRLAASIGGADHAIAGYGERPRIGGRLRDSRGRPIAGAEVEVVERFTGGSTLEPISSVVRTDARGIYSRRLAAGPSRRISVRFRGDRRFLPAGTDAGAARSRGLRHPLRLTSPGSGGPPGGLQRGRRGLWRADPGRRQARRAPGERRRHPPSANGARGLPDRPAGPLAHRLRVRALLRGSDPVPVPAQGDAGEPLALPRPGVFTPGARSWSCRGADPSRGGSDRGRSPAAPTRRSSPPVRRRLAADRRPRGRAATVVRQGRRRRARSGRRRSGR